MEAILWPLPPVGLAISSIGLLDALAFSVFIVWFAKRAILRIGGDRAHTGARPLFLGLAIGYTVGIGAGFIVDLLDVLNRSGADEIGMITSLPERSTRH